MLHKPASDGGSTKKRTGKQGESYINRRNEMVSKRLVRYLIGRNTEFAELSVAFDATRPVENQARHADCRHTPLAKGVEDT